MFCPRCRTEYRNGFTRCSDCGQPLTNEAPPSPQVHERGGLHLTVPYTQGFPLRGLPVSTAGYSSEADRYAAAWAEYRSLNRQVLAWALAFGLMVAAGQGVWAVTGRTGRANIMVGVMMFSAMVATVLAMIRAAQWRCPRCRAARPFRLSRRCYRCGLRKWQGQRLEARQDVTVTPRPPN